MRIPKTSKRPKFSPTLLFLISISALSSIAGNALKEGVFDLKLRGMEADDQRLIWIGVDVASGKTAADTPFIKAIGVAPENLRSVTLRQTIFEQPEIVVEVRDENAAMFYVDMNNNRKLDEGEKIPPAKVQIQKPFITFLTPDFDLTLEDGRTILYRIFFQVAPQMRTICWIPASIREGKGLIEGCPYRLTYVKRALRKEPFFGGDRIQIQEFNKDEKDTSATHFSSLSPIAPVDGRFYALSFSENNTRITLKSMQETLGRLAVTLATKNGVIATRPTVIQLRGPKDSKVSFLFRKPVGVEAFDLPPMEYRIPQLSFSYGDSWSVDVAPDEKTPLIAAVRKQETTTLEFGGAELEVKVVDMKNKNSLLTTQIRDADDRTFKVGQSLFINRVIRGKAGERFSRFDKAGASPRPIARLFDARDREIEGLTTNDG